MMLVKTNGLLCRALITFANPTPWLPRLFPLWIEQVRVGSDTTTWCSVRLGKPSNVQRTSQTGTKRAWSIPATSDLQSGGFLGGVD